MIQPRLPAGVRVSEIRDHRDHPVTRSLTITDPTRAHHRHPLPIRLPPRRLPHRARRRRETTPTSGHFHRPERYRDPHPLSGGGTIRDVEQATGVSWQAIAGRASWDERWRTAWDAALMASRNPNLDHGTFTAYTRDRCRCPVSSLPQTEDTRFSREPGRIPACPDPGEKAAERPGSRKPGTGIAKRRSVLDAGRPAVTIWQRRGRQNNRTPRSGVGPVLACASVRRPLTSWVRRGVGRLDHGASRHPVLVSLRSVLIAAGTSSPAILEYLIARWRPGRSRGRRSAAPALRRPASRPLTAPADHRDDAPRLNLTTPCRQSSVGGWPVDLSALHAGSTPWPAGPEPRSFPSPGRHTRTLLAGIADVDLANLRTPPFGIECPQGLRCGLCDAPLSSPAALAGRAGLCLR